MKPATKTAALTLLTLAVIAPSAHASPWTPAETTTTAWYDATDISTILTNGNSVTDWLDKSGNGFNMSQTDTSARPVTGNQINGNNAISFTSDYLTATNFSFPESGDLMLHVVNEMGAVTDRRQAMFSFGSQSGPNDCLFRSDNASQFLAELQVEGSGNSYIRLTNSPYVGTNIFTFVFNKSMASIYTAYVNGTKNAPDIPYGTKMDSDTIFTLMSTEAGGNKLSGSLGEVVATENVSEELRQTIEGYLAWKWGLETTLPADHPYRNMRPGGGTVIILY